MKVSWSEGRQARAVTGPLSLIVSAFAPVADARRTLTPQLRTDAGDTRLLLVDLAPGRQRLGGSVLAQAWGQLGNEVPDLDSPAALLRFFAGVRALAQDGKVLAYHDRSDGGLLATVCEMMFAGHAGVTLEIAAADVVAELFNEELGAVLQVRTADVPAVKQALDGAGIAVREIGRPNADDMLVVRHGGRDALRMPRAELHRAWSETTFHLQRLRDNPDCAQQEHDRLLDVSDPGIRYALSFDPAGDVAAPFIATGARPRVAILREQGVNGQVEMAAAFDAAGFEAVDVHMSDIIAGRVNLGGFRGAVACGGFSYGDVLGAGEGWAKSILLNARAREAFADFFGRSDTFALGVCNGCQMMSNLHEIIPGTAHWPHFVRNRSEQFEARFVTVEIAESPSLFFRGMAGSRIAVPTAHGEGYAEFADAAQLAAAQPLVTWRYVDNHGRATETYPFNPNGSPQGITGLTTADGRFTILMPHPERAFRAVQNSWHPDGWGEDGPWLRMFRNARVWAG